MFPETLMRERHDRKIQHHASYAASIPGAVTRPITLCATGGFHPDSHKYIMDLATSIAHCTGTSSRESATIILRKFAAKLVNLNARFFLDGVTSRNEWHQTSQARSTSPAHTPAGETVR